MKTIAAFVLISISTISASHAADVFELKSASLQKSESAELADLVLNFQDREPVSGVCALQVVRFEFVEAVKALIVQIKPTAPCPREDIGQRQAQLKWNLPASLYVSSNLKIILNDQLIGELKIVKGQIIVKTKP